MKRYEWRLKELAEKRGLTYIDLAEKLGRTRSFTHQLLKYRQIPVISGPELSKYLEVLDCGLEELIVQVDDETETGIVEEK